MSDGPGDLEADTTALLLGGWPQVFEQSPIATGIAVDFRYMRANPALCHLFGLRVDEIIGKDARSFLGPTLNAQIPGALEEFRQGERRVHLEGDLSRPDGVFRWVGIDAVLVAGSDRSHVTTLVQATDLTDLHQARTSLAASERRFRRLLTNVSDTVSITDADGNVVFTTGRQTKALGYPEGFWESTHPLDLVHPDDLDRAMGHWQDSLERPGVEISGEVRMRGAHGSWADVVVTGVNLLDDPDVAGIVVTTRNITAIRRAERLSSSQAAVLEMIAGGEPLSDIFERCVELTEDNGVG
ncbi:MAG: PAS domain S-box protein, partial [Acidimicrobiia bacterium]|nr:PAS domain S-box protein [Acidimicrobiia bacterium]